MELINNRILLIISIASLLLSFAQGLCVPRNCSNLVPVSTNLTKTKTPTPSPVPLSHISGVPQVDPALEKICAKTDNPALCSSTILPSLHGNVDPITALQTEIKASLDHTQNAVVQIKKMVKDPSTSRVDISSLQVCQEVYESAVDDLNGAIDAIATHDLATVQTTLSAVITDIGTCDDVVTESPGFKLPFKEEDVATLHKLASNCMAISTLL